LFDDLRLAFGGAALRLEAANLLVELQDLQAQLLLLVGDHPAIRLKQLDLTRYNRRG
jgi:hypothetical protein